MYSTGEMGRSRLRADSPERWPPNMRVQRTRSSASPPHSPLTRSPLGGLGRQSRPTEKRDGDAGRRFREAQGGVREAPEASILATLPSLVIMRCTDVRGRYLPRRVIPGLVRRCPPLPRRLLGLRTQELALPLMRPFHYLELVGGVLSGVWGRTTMRPPNTRVQRTRSSASPPHSPLTRSPLGGSGLK